jgi:hypothetical protein
MDLVDKLKELGVRPCHGQTFRPVSDKQIAEIQQKVNARLPEDYKRFLATFGESTFSSQVNCTPSGKPLYFGWFYGPPDLLEAIENCKEDEVLPETIIPIGDDGGGNLFCLGVSGKDIGKVYFHNHGIGWHADAERLMEQGKSVPSDIRYQTVYECASSFQEFIENMVNEG